MPILTLLLVLCVVGAAMYMIHSWVPSPFSWILLVICGIALVVLVLQLAGVNLGAVRIGG